MAGTKSGGKAAAKTNTMKWGADFYKRIGAIGGRKGHTGGFFVNRELARIAGAKGGRISRRVPSTEEKTMCNSCGREYVNVQTHYRAVHVNKA